jgi:hypothetical protein
VAAVTEVRVAQLFDEVHPVAGPYFSVARERIEDEAERRRVADYLSAGTVVLYTTATDRDWVDASRGRPVGMSYRTDGDWVWSEGLGYYVTTHGIAPDPDFYTHIRARAYRCSTVDDATGRRALAALHAARDR